MNSLRYLPCFCLIEEAFLFSSLPGLAECIPSNPLLPSLSVRTEPAQIRFYCIYLFIYSYLFSISEASYQRPANLRSRVAWELWANVFCVCRSVCSWIKLKYKQKGNVGIITFVIASSASRFLLLTNSSRVLKQKTPERTRFITQNNIF